MRTALAILAVILVPVGSALAVEYRTPVTKQLFTCAGGSMSRVVMQAIPARCCDGRLRCAEFLSTTGMLRSVRDPRT